MYGKNPFENLDMEFRKRLFATFEAFCRRAPYSCKLFAYRRSEVPTPEAFGVKFARDLVSFLKDNLSYFQQFEQVKVYYDNGQQMVSDALHTAIDSTLSKEAIMYKAANAQEYRLAQVADCICALELVDLKFQHGELTNTDIKMFGTNYSAFKRNHLKHIRRKELGRS